jgi:hypothetical protein
MTRITLTRHSNPVQAQFVHNLFTTHENHVSTTIKNIGAKVIPRLTVARVECALAAVTEEWREHDLHSLFNMDRGIMGGYSHNPIPL